MKEEDQLLRKVGTENPFSVPEHYFEHLTSDIMNKLPEHEHLVTAPVQHRTLWNMIKPYAYLAAMFVGAALIIRVARHTPVSDSQNTLSGGLTDSDQTEIATEDGTLLTDEDLDYTLNQAMLEDYSLYVYLTAANADTN